MEGIGGNLEEMRRVPLADAHVEQIRAISQERHYMRGGCSRTGLLPSSGCNAYR